MLHTKICPALEDRRAQVCRARLFCEFKSLDGRTSGTSTGFSQLVRTTAARVDLGRLCLSQSFFALALILAHRAFMAFEILLLPAAESLPPLRTIFLPTPSTASIALSMAARSFLSRLCSCFSTLTTFSIRPPVGYPTSQTRYFQGFRHAIR